MREKTKLLDNIDNFLQSKNGYKKSWLRSFIAIFLCAICFGVVLGISYNLGPLSNKSFNLSQESYETTLALPTNAYLLQCATYMSIAGISIMVFPFICGMATWMIGINQVTKSKYFHLFIWLMVTVAIILAIVSIVFLIRASIFTLNEFPNVAPPTESGS